jgi:hypothetical protein
MHWNGAGDRERAYQYTKRAAVEASNVLAFERAARLYRRCLEMLDHDAPEAEEIRAAVGDALANAGLGAEAANAYLSAAERSTERAVELYASAAGHLLRSGHVDSGLEVLRRALTPLGLHLPATPMRALVSLLTQRVLIRFRGLRFRERSENEISRRDLTRVDVSWALAAAFALIDVIRGAAIQSRHLRVALSTGEPHRIGRAMAIEVGYRVTAGSRGGDSAWTALSEAEALAARLGNPPNLVGQNTLMAGIGGICEGRWAAAEDLCVKAETILRDRGSGVAWELSSSRIMQLWALWYLGRVSQIDERLPTLLRESQDRGDLYAATSFNTFFTPMCRLVADDVEAAARVAHNALERWSQQGFHFQHYFRLFASVQIELYRDDAAKACELVEATWPALKASFLLGVQQNKVEALHFRGRAELAFGRKFGDKKMLARAAKRAKAIRREKSVWGDGLARLLEAGVAWTRGDATLAARVLDEAIALLEGREMALFAAAARRALGLVVGGERGAALIEHADSLMTALGVANPARMAAMLVPGFAPTTPALPSALIDAPSEASAN